MKILAVDDDEMILEILKIALAQSGFHDVETATSAVQAMAMVDAAPQPYDCLMLDIQMPEIDGIAFCTWVKRKRGYATTPVIMVTAMSDRSFVQRAFAAGATDYVTKPFDALELGTRVSLAQRLVQEGSRVREKAMEVRLLRDEMEREARVSYGEPVTVSDVPGVIGLVNLENYLLQMSRGDLGTTTLMAVKVEGLEAYHRSLAATDYYFLLADVAEALSQSLRGRDFFVAYGGSGAFAVVMHGTGPDAVEELELAATDLLQSMGATEGLVSLTSAGTGLATNTELRFRCGVPARVGMLRAGSSAVQLLYVTLAQLEQDIAARDAGTAGTEQAATSGLAGLLQKLWV
jgi:CheY-like chemotaxis protein